MPALKPGRMPRTREENLASVGRNSLHAATSSRQRTIPEPAHGASACLNPLELTPKNMKRYLVFIIILMIAPAIPANA
ncbi:MAG TPA: hypothetical protein VMM36_05705, partial [Opitutaceae bacterium]|nr:hypothetical protein [Opitutaceae bacterium]